MGPFNSKIFGTTVVNDKGQVVIPAEARNAMGLEPGSRLMVMGLPHKNTLMLIKTEDVEKIIENFTTALGQEGEGSG